MRQNIRQFVELVSEAFTFVEPVLEIGACQTEGQEGFADLRPLFSSKEYIGCDFRAGPGVDVLADTHALAFDEARVGTVLMIDTLEHVQNPFQALQEAHRVLRPDGMILATSVMDFPIHDFPADYWRFTPAAFDLLLSPFEAKAVFHQGDPEFPHSVIGLARKAADLEEEAAFMHTVGGLEAMRPGTLPGGPLVRFEPLEEAVVMDRQDHVTPEVTATASVSQTFRCPLDFLTRIDLRLTTHNRWNRGRLVLRLEEEREAGWRAVAESRLPAVHVEDGAWAPFRFPSLVDSGGRHYRMTLSSPDARPGNAVSVYRSDEPLEESERLCVNDQPQPGTLCFRAFCRTEERSQPPSHHPATGKRRPQRTASRKSATAETATLARLQSEQLWYVAARVQERIDQLFERLDIMQQRSIRMERTLDEQAQYLRWLQSSPLHRLVERLSGRSRSIKSSR
jgi:hypothetical protein